MPRGRPHASWLRKVESYLEDAGMAGLASAWAMARRRPKEYRRKVDAATRCSGVCPIPDLTITWNSPPTEAARLFRPKDRSQ